MEKKKWGPCTRCGDDSTYLLEQPAKAVRCVRCGAYNAVVKLGDNLSVVRARPGHDKAPAASPGTPFKKPYPTGKARRKGNRKRVRRAMGMD